MLEDWVVPYGVVWKYLVENYQVLQDNFPEVKQEVRDVRNRKVINLTGLRAETTFPGVQLWLDRR